MIYQEIIFSHHIFYKYCEMRVPHSLQRPGMSSINVSSHVSCMCHQMFISTTVSSTRRGEVTQQWTLEGFPVVSPTTRALAHRVRKRTSIIWMLLNSTCISFGLRSV